MSVTLWLDTASERTIELGATLAVYEAFSEMTHAAGAKWQSEYPDLAGVLSQCESQEDADPDWLASVREQATRFAREFKVGPEATGILEELAGSRP